MLLVTTQDTICKRINFTILEDIYSPIRNLIIPAKSRLIWTIPVMPGFPAKREYPGKTGNRPGFPVDP